MRAVSAVTVLLIFEVKLVEVFFPLGHFCGTLHYLFDSGHLVKVMEAGVSLPRVVQLVGLEGVEDGNAWEAFSDVRIGVLVEGLIHWELHVVKIHGTSHPAELHSTGGVGVLPKWYVELVALATIGVHVLEGDRLVAVADVRSILREGLTAHD